MPKATLPKSRRCRGGKHWLCDSSCMCVCHFVEEVDDRKYSEAVAYAKELYQAKDNKEVQNN